MPGVHTIKTGMIVYLELTSSKTFIDKYIYVHPKKGKIRDLERFPKILQSK